MDLKVYTYHLGRRLQLKEVRALFEEKPIKSDSTFLLYQLSENSFVYVKNFGCLTFVNVPTEIKDSITDELSNGNDDWIGYDSFTILVRENEALAVDFDTATIPELSVDLIHIIALNLAQSAALTHYQVITDELLEKSRELSTHLEVTGEVKMTRRKLSKFIGQTMSLRNRIADNLYIFEAPPLAWKEARLTELDTLLSNELDFENRYRAMQASLSVVRENHEFYKDVLQHKHSSLLEWIIIILILFEVVQIFID
ncbi:MAG: RMD1 family protein [bacterium]|nr:RMD1 family protein [bacterium]